MDGKTFGPPPSAPWIMEPPQGEVIPVTPIEPAHYRTHPSGVEAIDITEHFNFCLGNAIKYIWRSDHKGDPIECLKKARWYINREIERRERQSAQEGSS